MRRTDLWYILKLLKDIHFSLNFFLGHLLRYVLCRHEWVVLVNGIYANRKQQKHSSSWRIGEGMQDDTKHPLIHFDLSSCYL